MTGRARVWGSEAGYGLISVLVAVVLLAIGVVVLSTSSVFLSALQTDAAVRSTAAAIALGYMEEIKTRDREGLGTEEPVRVDERGVPAADGRFVRSLQVEPEPDVVDAVRVNTSVVYPGGMGRRRSVEVVTIIYVGS